MLTIAPEQFILMEEKYKILRRGRILKMIRINYNIDIKNVDDLEALRRIDLAIEDGKLIDITADEDVCRLAFFAFLPSSQLNDPTIVWAMTRVLCRQDWDAAKRLDFIEDHIICSVATET